MVRLARRPAGNRPARPQTTARPRAADIADDPPPIPLAALVDDPDCFYVWQMAWECHTNELGMHNDRTTRAELVGLLALLEMRRALQEKADREGGAA